MGNSFDQVFRGTALTAAGGAGLDVADVFSTFLYDGTNGDNHAIVNGIDLSGEGGFVWIKSREVERAHALYDTARGVHKYLQSDNNNAAQVDLTSSNDKGVKAFNANGFTMDDDALVNADEEYVSWTFRKAEKFFDIVTYEGNSQTSQTLNHNLGSVPGMIIVKRYDGTGEWWVYHRGNTAAPQTDFLRLSSSNATSDYAGAWNDTAPTSTQFTVGSDSAINYSSRNYVAYIFAHNNGDGEFGPAGDQDIISCGSASATGLTTVNLGFEPQFVLIKSSNIANAWYIFDNMRGLTVNYAPQVLHPSDTSAEYTDDAADTCNLTSTGFTFNSSRFNGNGTYVYMAIRAPMITPPAAATNVFKTVVYTGDNASSRLLDMSNEVGQVSDMILARRRDTDQDELSRTWGYYVGTKLLGLGLLNTGYNNGTDDTNTIIKGWDSNKGINLSNGGGGTTYGISMRGGLNINTDSNNHTANVWTRAKGFFDVVVYKGTGSAQTVTHQLGVVPEMMWVKRLASGGVDWAVYYGDNTDYIPLNQGATNTADSAAWWNDTSPTDSVFTVNTQDTVNSNNVDYICYLFATLDGVSKIGTYTGNNSTQTIDCGFTNGARFVLIKGVDGGGGWMVFDTARGIIAGNDPTYELASNGSEPTLRDHIDPHNSGFSLTSNKADSSINANGTAYFFYAIA